MKKRMLEYVNVLFGEDSLSSADGHMSRAIASLVLAIAALLMLIQNIMINQVLMTYCSILLVVGFFISFVLAYFFKDTKVSSIIITLLVGLILSIFAVSGGNNGFAILWILLVPIMATNLLGIKNGLAISTYFLIFIFAIFYTPLKERFMDYYTIEFMNRFPVLFFSDYVISTFLSLQKEFYFRETNKKSYIDELTGVYNRRYFMESLKDNNNHKGNFGIIIIDVNGLKMVNDSLGHLAGDELIKAVPDCFSKVFKSNIKICRIGGDEFAIITNDSVGTVKENIKKAKEVASEYDGKYINKVSFSTGYASKDEFNIDDLNELFHKADELMYTDKSNYYKKHNRRSK